LFWGWCETNLIHICINLFCWCPDACFCKPSRRQLCTYVQ
jgi:hypothetical protein